MSGFCPDPGVITYSTLKNSDGEWQGMYFGDPDLDKHNISNLKDDDLTNLRNQLVNVLTIAENEMETRGFFRRYTTKDQD